MAKAGSQAGLLWGESSRMAQSPQLHDEKMVTQSLNMLIQGKKRIAGLPSANSGRT